MRFSFPELDKPLTPDGFEARRPFVPSKSSAAMNWPGIRIEDVPLVPAHEVDVPPLTHLFLALHGQAIPRGISVRTEGCRYEAKEGPPGSVSVVPAGLEWEHRCGAMPDVAMVHIGPEVVARVAAEAFDFDPGRLELRPIFYDPWPLAAAALAALRDEVRHGGLGGRLCVESLTNVLVVQVIRRLAGRQVARGGVGRLAEPTLNAVVEYIMANLARDIALADLAAVAHLSEFHFARIFKATTGQSPHRFVVGRRIERAKNLLAERRLTLSQVAAAVGFTDQSHFIRQFKRVVGVTPSNYL